MQIKMSSSTGSHFESTAAELAPSIMLPAAAARLAADMFIVEDEELPLTFRVALEAIEVEVLREEAGVPPMVMCGFRV
jgi:hypothetical protein